MKRKDEIQERLICLRSLKVLLTPKWRSLLVEVGIRQGKSRAVLRDIGFLGHPIVHMNGTHPLNLACVYCSLLPS